MTPAASASAASGPSAGRTGLRRGAIAAGLGLGLAAWAACAHAGAGAAPAPASACDDTALRAAAPPRALAMAAAALREHAAFGGQALDAEGRLVRGGASEAEDTRRSPLSVAPWQRVLGYWRAIEDGGRPAALPDAVRFGAGRPASRRLLRQALDQASAPRLRGLGAAPGQGLESTELLAIGAALDRAAVMDTPWSAAFIGSLARDAGLGADEFVFSQAHADYAGAAWQATVAETAGRPTPQALRACDLARTTPRTGDLVCQARGAVAGLDSFAALGAVLADRPSGGAAVPMHCDVVTRVDATGFDAVGGNVLQSVTLRRLDFAPGTAWLDPSYLPAGCTARPDGCVDRHLSRQPWSLLLQWR